MGSVKITSHVVYTIRDIVTGDKFEAKGVEGLDRYVEDVLGGAVDRLCSSVGNVSHYRNKLATAEYITKNRSEFQHIFELMDLVEEIKNPKDDEEMY